MPPLQPGGRILTYRTLASIDWGGVARIDQFFSGWHNGVCFFLMEVGEKNFWNCLGAQQRRATRGRKESGKKSRSVPGSCSGKKRDAARFMLPVSRAPALLSPAGGKAFRCSASRMRD